MHGGNSHLLEKEGYDSPNMTFMSKKRFRDDDTDFTDVSYGKHMYSDESQDEDMSMTVSRRRKYNEH
eukprot:6201824-Pleurochrysis_carterae.AAC.1